MENGLYGPLTSIPFPRLNHETTSQREKESYIEFILVQYLKDLHLVVLRLLRTFTNRELGPTTIHMQFPKFSSSLEPYKRENKS